MEKHKMAACGIDCNECGQYKVTMQQDMAEAEGLTGWFKSQGWIGADEGAEAVMKLAPLCRGCWDQNNADVHFAAVCANCGIRACCEGRRLNHCGECADLPCSRYDAWIDGLEHHKKALQHLLSLKANM